MSETFHDWIGSRNTTALLEAALEEVRAIDAWETELDDRRRKERNTDAYQRFIRNFFNLPETPHAL